MPDANITFELGGRVDIKQMSEGIAAFNHLIEALTGREEIKWLVVDLQSGSAIATLRPDCENPAVSERIIQDYKNVGKALQNKEEIPGNNRVKFAAESIRKLVDSVEYLRLGAVGENFYIYENAGSSPKPLTATAVGSVTGRVQTLSDRGSLRFNLYDTIHDKSVSCYLTQGQEELMRTAWGRRATVSGRVTREIETGRPITIRGILDVQIQEDCGRLLSGRPGRRPVATGR
jgi:hypothetical protein